MSTTQGWNEPIPTGGYGTGAGLPDAEPEFTGSTAGLAHLPEGWRWRVQMVGRGMRFVPVPPGLADPGTVRLRASLTTPPSLPPPVPSIPSTPTPLAPMSAPPPAVQTPAVQTPAGPVASAPVWPVQPAPARPARSPIPSGQELAAIADMLSGSAERLAEEEWRRLARIMPQIDWSAPTPAVTPPEDAAPEEPAAVAPVMAPADAITQPMAAVPADVAATPAPAVEFAPPAAYAPAPVVPLASFAPPTPTPGVPEPIDALPPGTVAAILGAVDADLGGPEFANPEPATPEGVMSEVPESQEPAIPGAPAYPEPVAAPAVLPELPAEAESGLPTVPIAVEPPAAYREAGVAPEGAPGMAAPAVAEAPAPVVVDETPGPSRARGFSWGHVTFPNVVRAEWIKLWSLVSTWVVLGIFFLVTVGFGAVQAFGFRTLNDNPDMPAGAPAGPWAASDVAVSLGVGQLVISILAVLYITNEYSSGQIRSSLSAVPGRLSLLIAKTGVIAAVTFALSFIASYGAVLVGWPLISSFATDDRFGHALRIVAGLSLATTLVAIFALAVGALIRNTAAGIGIVLGLLFVIGIVFLFLPWHWASTLHAYMIDMSQAGLAATNSSTAPYGFVKSLWVTSLWAFVPLIAAGVLLKKRDA